jgi:carboxymethylenebutenolidase
MAASLDRAIRILGIIAAAVVAASCDGAGSPSASASPAPQNGTPGAAPATAAAHEPASSSTVAPRVSLVEQQVAYGESATRNLVGFLAMPADAAEPLPGIIVIHDSWGLNDDVKAVTRRLAAEGYVALAVDLFGGVTAETPEQAQPLLKALVVEPDTPRANLEAAYEYLEKYALAPRIASIGWSLGGAWSLQLALMLPEQLDAVVIYYGQIVNRESALETLQMPILGFFAGLDESIPAREVQYFRSTLSALGKPAEILIYTRAGPGFATPGSANYDEKSAAESWAKTVAFLNENLKPAR